MFKEGYYIRHLDTHTQKIPNENSQRSELRGIKWQAHQLRQLRT